MPARDLSDLTNDELEAELVRRRNAEDRKLPAVAADTVVILDELEREWFERYQGELIPADEGETPLATLAFDLWAAATWAPHSRRTIAEATQVVVDALAAVLAVEEGPEVAPDALPFTILRYAAGAGCEVAGMSSGSDKADALERFQSDACGGLGAFERHADGSASLTYSGDVFVAEELPR